MDAPGLADRHAVLDPKQRLSGFQLGLQETRPAAVTRLIGKNLAESRLGRRGQRKWTAQTRWNGTFFSRADPPAGDEGKLCSHTTRNAYVLLLFLFPRVREQSQGCDSGDSGQSENCCLWGKIPPVSVTHSVPLYFFDTRDDDKVIRDDVGLEFPGLEEVKRQAAKSLAEMAVDVLPGALRRVLGVDVRDEDGDAVLTAELIFEARILKP